MTSETLFEVIHEPDHTIPGEPPEISNEDYDFVSYFENKNGHHLIFVYDGESETGTLYNSKEGWQEVTTVSKEDIEESDLLLHYNQEEGEAKWLHSVMLSLQPRFKVKR